MAGPRPSVEDPDLYQDVNIRGTLNLIELAVKQQVKHFVFASSSSVYGRDAEVPYREDGAHRPAGVSLRGNKENG